MAGRVSIIVLDNGATAVQVPTSSTQLVIGTSSTGTVGQVYASTSPQNITNTFGFGPMPEAASMVAAVGGVAVCVRATSNTAGAASTVTHTGTGTSVVTVSGTPLDTYYFLVTVVTGGTVGTAGCVITVSYDNGRSASPQIALGTANTYVIPNSGVTLNLAAGTLVAGDTFTIGTTEPLWNTAGVQAAINAFLASAYKANGIGSVHIVGGSTATNFAIGAVGSDMVAIGGFLQSLRTNQYIFTRGIMSTQDAKPPVAFGGTGESEATWEARVNSDFTGQSLNSDTTGRLSVTSAFWNMTSQLTNGLGNSPRFRRPVSYAVAQRVVQISPQQMPSRVRSGALSPIVIGVGDKADGFVYHDESISPFFDSNTGGAGHLSSTTTIQGQSGIFLLHANLMGQIGSVIGFLPQGLVLDIACSIAYQIGVLNIDDDVRTVPATGTIDPRDAVTIQNAIASAIKANMTDRNMLVGSAANPYGCTVTVDQTHIFNTLQGGDGNLPIQLQIFGKGYILTETISVGFAPAAAA